MQVQQRKEKKLFVEEKGKLGGAIINRKSTRAGVRNPRAMVWYWSMAC